MAKSSLDELRGRIAAGEYALDSGTLAADMLSKFTLIRRVRLMLTGEDEETAARATAPSRLAQARRRTRLAASRPGPRTTDPVRNDKPR